MSPYERMIQRYRWWLVRLWLICVALQCGMFVLNVTTGNIFGVVVNTFILAGLVGYWVARPRIRP